MTGFVRLRGLIMHCLMKRKVNRRHLGTYTEKSWEVIVMIDWRVMWLARQQ